MFMANRAMRARRAQNFPMQLGERRVRRIAAAEFRLQAMTE
jgi:hypothetical protein